RPPARRDRCAPRGELPAPGAADRVPRRRTAGRGGNFADRRRHRGGARMNLLISAASLAALLQAPGPDPVLLDVRWSLGRSDGRELYAAGHIPGAVFVDLERELSSAPGPGTGRHPLPLPAD